MDDADELLSISQAARLLGHSNVTLRRWEKQGKISSVRVGGEDGGQHRRFLKSQIEAIVQPTQAAPTSEAKSLAIPPREKIAYARVSSVKHKDDLERQVQHFKTRYPEHVLVSDIGSGLNYNRKGLWSILERVFDGRVEEVVVAHSDRLSRFSFRLFEKIFAHFATKLVVEDSQADKSPELELAEDICSVLTVFSCRIHGKRRYGNKSGPKRKRSTEEARSGSKESQGSGCKLQKRQTMPENQGHSRPIESTCPTALE
jgi:excisionase family DNA binding protein